ncbi:aspartate/glutamate racemase family protein [Rhodotorula paludigena]|uniref:aspartate/glutamate racemase family protein n=1 Tax=Rhodotorula paludigena TaxID=86838 RepID=UPI00317FF9EC
MDRPFLVINPNTTVGMTQGVEQALAKILQTSKLPYPTLFTAPSGIPSINDDEGCHASADAVLPHLLQSPASALDSTLASLPPSTAHLSLADAHSAVLIACYSVHPLVSRLAAHYSEHNATTPVLGIFEASILASLALLHAPQDRFGIVTTGAVWDGILTRGVRDFLGARDEQTKLDRFAGVETTGLTAVELHDMPADEVSRRLKEAVKRLIARARGAEGNGALRAVCLGCAGMAGMEQTVRAACVEELGDADGRKVHIVDGVKAGYVLLEGMLRTQL